MLPSTGIDPDEVIEPVIHAPMYQQLSREIFTHTVTPNLSRLGLITERTDHLWRAAGLIGRPAVEQAA